MNVGTQWPKYEPTCAGAGVRRLIDARNFRVLGVSHTILFTFICLFSSINLAAVQKYI
ncbi:hypothetical protein BDZ94DRAFT_1247245, partial [Collybia nuda]